MNGTGVVVGYVTKSTKSGLIAIAVQWMKTGSTWTVEVLPGLGGPESFAKDINDNGWATGFAKVSTGKNRAVLWVPGQSARDLGALGAESWGYAITPASAATTVVVGVGNIASATRGIIWRP
jgi:probable HAF family extracellular repeat protein